MKHTMNDIQYRRATIEDAGKLADNRIAFLTDYLGPQTDEDIAMLRTQLEKYFAESTGQQTYVSWVALAGEDIAGAGGMTIRVQPGNFRNPTGRTGYIMNMYTLPEYRRLGIARTILRLLTEAGTEMGLTAFELHATPDGEPVYIEAGFKKHHEPTYRKYIFGEQNTGQ